MLANGRCLITKIINHLAGHLSQFRHRSSVLLEVLLRDLAEPIHCQIGRLRRQCCILWSEFCRVPSRWLHLLRFRLDAGFFVSRSNIIGERDIASVWKTGTLFRGSDSDTLKFRE
jgi:hypothetical protein